MMRKGKQRNALLVAAGLLLLLAACENKTEEMPNNGPTIIPAASPTIAGGLPEGTAAPTAVPDGAETLTEAPSAPEGTTAPTEAPEEITPTPEATLTPTATPTPTESPTPTATPLPTATPTPAGTVGEVSFSEAGYFFSDTLEVELVIRTQKEGYVTYTIDGTEPAEDGTRYEAPLVLETTEDASPKAYSIRAKAWYADGTCSDTYVHTYFVGKNIAERFTTMVFSISGNPAELTEGPDGILYGENYTQRGRESERVVSIEALSAEGDLLFSQYAGARVFGGTSRKHPVKSLKLFARKEYQEGKGTFETTVFGSMALDGVTPIKKYDKLVLRNMADDFQRAYMRDELAQRLAAQAGFDAYEAVVPAVAYLNGEYYGFYWLHESYCDKFFQYRNGKSKGEYIVLEGSDEWKSISDDEAEAAAAKEYNALYKKYSRADLTNDETYQELLALVDVENYIEYMAFNMYISNNDWPQGNYRCFRYYAAENEAYGEGEMDGRWRYLVHDMDIGFATYYTAEKSAQRNDIKAVLTDSGDRYSPLLTALLKREDCKQFFIDTMLRYRDGVLSYENVCEVVDAMCAERDAELTYYIAHLRSMRDEYEIYTSESATEASVQKIKDFTKLRRDYITTFMEDFFGVELE